MLVNASVWLILFLCSIGKLAYDKKKLASLKYSGVCAEADIAEMIPAVWVRVGNYTAGRIVCRFVYGDREYTAISSYYVLSPFQRREDLYANVYIDKNDPAKYGVELFQSGRLSVRNS